MNSCVRILSLAIKAVAGNDPAKRILGIFVIVAGVTSLPAPAAALQPLAPEDVTLDNGDVAIRCATLGHVAKKAGFFDDVPNGGTLMDRFITRMIEITRNASPDATDSELKARMSSAFSAYKKLASGGDKSLAGRAMKADFQVCLGRAEELFGSDLLPNK